MDINKIKNLKIVPENYECATVFEVVEISKDAVKINLPKAAACELEGYNKGGHVEMFGLGQEGLVYFTSDILDKTENIITINPPVDFRNIQRRKYSRVPFLGSLLLEQYEQIKITPVDISAGGVKFISNTTLKTNVEYEIKIELINNLAVNCTVVPIRVLENNNGAEISAKFKQIRSIDRIALMQYSLRLKSETENKG